MPSPDLSERLRCLIQAHTSDRRRAKELEEMTGVPAASWKNFWTRKQRPTVQMIETAAKQWPQFALWLATGCTDEATGHSAPDNAWGLNPGRRADPEREKETETYLALTHYLHYLIYGRSAALEANLKVKKNPTPDEIEKAKETTAEEGKLGWSTSDEINVYEPKFKDLDEALDSLARQRWINQQVERFGLAGLSKLEQREKLTALRHELTDLRTLEK